MGDEQSESFLAFHSFFAELVVGTEAGGVCVEGVGAVFEDYLESVDSVAVLVEVISEVHRFVDIIYKSL